MSTTDGAGMASKGQANQTMSTLNALFNWARDHYEIDGKPVIAFNPVSTLRENNKWHLIEPRKSIVPLDKLADWYRGVIALNATAARDMMLVALFAGLCPADTVNLEWDDVDFGGRRLNVRTKHGRLHQIPLSDYLFDLFSLRLTGNTSQYVFPGRFGRCPIQQFHQVMEKAWQACGFHFTIQDLRRTFLVVLEGLELPLYAVKALSNRSQRRSRRVEPTEYDFELLREPMQRVTDRLLLLMEADPTLLQEPEEFYLRLASRL